MSVPYYSGAQKGTAASPVERNFLNRHNREFEQEDSLDYWAISAITVDHSDAEYNTYRDPATGLVGPASADTSMNGQEPGREDSAGSNILRWPGSLDPDEGMQPIVVTTTAAQDTEDGQAEATYVNTD